MRDIHRWSYPGKYFLSESLQNGSIPYWCPHYFCGSPFLSDLQSGVFYPLSFLFAAFPFPWSFNLYVCTHFFLGLIFFHGFVISLGLSKKTALLVSVSFCYGSFVIASVNTLNNLSSAIWLPAVLWAFHEAVVKRNRSAYGWGILSLTSCLLAGEPQLFLLTVALLGVFAVSIDPFEQRPPILSPVQNLGMVFVMLVSVGLIAAAQLGPTFTDYMLSVRQEGFSFDEAAKHSLHPSMLKHLLMPLVFPPHFETDPLFLTHFFPGSSGMPWLLTLYPGAVILPLACVGLFSRFRKSALLWLLVFVASLALALGEHAPFYRMFYLAFPAFRFPEKFVFPAIFSLLLMAAYGFEHLLLRLKKRRRYVIPLAFAVLAFLGLDLFRAHRNLNPMIDSAFYQAYDPHLQPILDDPDHFRVYVDPGILASGGATVLEHHIRWQKLLMPNLGILRKIDHVDGTTGLELRYQYMIAELLERPWPEKMRFLKMANVKYIVSLQNLEEHKELAGHLEKVNPLVFKIKNPLPRAWMVGQVSPLKTGTMEELLETSFDPSRQAIAGGVIPDFPQAEYFGDVDSLQYEKGGRIRIRATPDRTCILVLSESSYPGWRVLVNGEEKPCLWLNLFFQGVTLSPGQNEIVFEFQPKHFSSFASLSLVSLFLSCLILFLPRKKMQQA